jgi:class 3 adenylate cyclase/tetratricopeptide (TPR) repeat protein
VVCSNCNTENEPGHSFCSNCGSALSITCPSCSTANGSANKFCFNCGSQLHSATGSGQSQSGAADIAERRLVSVVFADLVGYTSFSEDRDAEDVRAMLTTYYERCRDIIGRYGGTTDKFIGDAVMGVWGAETANEDDAERATRAALELVDMVAGLGSEIAVPELSARAGVLSGEAAVGPGGNLHGLVVGDLVNTASRLQSLAPPGAVLVGQSTRDLVGGAIEFAAFGEHTVKGKEIPVSAFQALRVVARSGTRRGSDLREAPFVGRGDELRMLKDQLHATGRDGRARLVSIVGEGGIGKSRLAQELLRYIDGITEDVYYHNGRSPAYGDGVTFWALGEMVRHRAGISEGEDPMKSRMKLRTVVAEFVPDEEDQTWIESRLAALIGIASMPAGDRSEMFSALRTFFQRIAQRGTVLMVFEDLHWADAGLLDFVDELVERTTQHPILVVTLARPDLLDRRPAWGSGRRQTLSIHLSRLDSGSMRALTGGLAPGLPETMVNRIADRAAGIPLHAVEFVRMLMNSGRLEADGDRFRFLGDDEDLTIPDSVSAIIGARLDRLDADELAVVQDGSVVGMSMTLASVSELQGKSPEAVGPLLRSLVRSEILEFDEDPRSPERGQFRFVQGLIREVAYARLSRSERVNRHLAIAQRLEADGDVEVAGIIAGHYANAAAAAPDNAEVVEHARRAVVAAAERAASLHSDVQAASLYEQAIEMMTDPAEVALLQLAAAESWEADGEVDKATDLARLALEFYRDVGDDDGIVSASVRLSEVLSGNFEADKAVEIILPVYEATPQRSDLAWAQLAVETSRALMLAARAVEAIAVADVALPILEELDLVAEVVHVLINKGTALGNAGRWLEGSALLRGAADIAGAHDLLPERARALNNLAIVVGPDDLRDPRILEEVIHISERLGSRSWILRSLFLGAIQTVALGELDEALEKLSLVDSLDVPDFWAEQYTITRNATMMLRHGFDAELSRELFEVLERYLASTDPQLRGLTINFQANALICAGRAAEVAKLIPDMDRVTGSYPEGLETAAFAAGWVGDHDSIRTIGKRLDADYRRGRATRGLRRFVAAVDAAFSGDKEGAVAAFRDGELLWQETVGPMNLAVMRALFAKTIGLDNPVGHEAGVAARTFFEEHRVKLHLELLADGLPQGGADETDLAV